MKKLFILSYFLLLISFSSFSQSVGIGTNTPNTSALLDVTATNRGVLVPRVTNAQMNAIASPANGLLVYNTDSSCFAYRHTAAWVFLKGNATASNDWSTKGNAGTDTSKNFMGTTDNVDLIFKRNNVRAGLLNKNDGNTSWGAGAMSSQYTGFNNTATGVEALAFLTAGLNNAATGFRALYQNTSGNSNAAHGSAALFNNTTGNWNVAQGNQALWGNVAGSFNVAAGYRASHLNISGNSNVAVGTQALYNNNNRSNLVAVGDSALFNNGTGVSSDEEAAANTAIGSKALFANTTGYDNTAVGFRALNTNSSGNGNTAVGRTAMFYNTSGSFNAAFGKNALGVSSGDGNTAIGYSALVNNTGNYNTAVGMYAMGGDIFAGNNNTALGYQAGSINRGSGNVFLGYRAGENETGSDKLYITNDTTNSSNTLVYGEFDNKLLRSNGRMEINSDNTIHEGLTVKKNYASGTNKNLAAVYGENTVDTDYGIGVVGKGGNIGVLGQSGGSAGLAYTGVKGISDGVNTGFNYGIIGQASGSALENRAITGEATGTTGDKYGLYGFASGGGGTNMGVYAKAIGGTTNYAGWFEGDVQTNNGKLIITTAAGATGLDLSTSDAYAEMRVIRNTLGATDNDLYFGFGGSAGSGLHLYSDALETVTIKNNITGVGKTPTVSDNYGKLQVKQSGSLNAITMEAAGNTNHWDFSVPTVTNADLLLFYNGVAKGAFSNSTGAYTTNSDRRLKKDISPQADVLNHVMQLQAYRYHYIDNKPTDNFTNGFMAQEVQKLFPDAVVENDMKNGEKRLGINYQYFTVLAIKGLQEQQQQIQSQEERIAKLEALVKTLTGGK